MRWSFSTADAGRECLFPDATSGSNAQDFIFGPGARAFICFGFDGRQVPLIDMMRRNVSSLFVAGLPTW
jgi:hypothetical protein